MNITTKFNVGDTVYTLVDGKLCIGEVTSFNVQVMGTEAEPAVGIAYKISGEGVNCVMPEEELFESANTLTDSLLARFEVAKLRYTERLAKAKTKAIVGDSNISFNGMKSW